LAERIGPRRSAPAEDDGRLDIELTAPRWSLPALLWSDYEAALVDREEGRLRARILYLPRLLVNPSLQLSLLVRLAQKGPRLLLHPIRWIQVIFFSTEIHGFRGSDAVVLGPAVAFPHPWNIIIGRGTKIGSGVTIYNNTNIGANRHLPQGASVTGACRLGDRSVVYAYSAVQGPFDVGQDAVVGIHVVLDGHVPPGALRTHRKLRLEGEWPGEERRHWRPREDDA
jgi:serine acetyltransferase